MASSNSRTGQASSTAANVTEHKIFLSKSSKKSFQVMKFNKEVDFEKWGKATMQRENNSNLFEAENDKLPEFGQGSEFGLKERQLAKRRRFQDTKEVYNLKEQPWILKTVEVEENSCKEYKSQMGGIFDNAAFYVLNQVEGGLEASPIEDWYNFQIKSAAQKFSIEEVEVQFKNRNKYMNYVALLDRIQVTQEEDEDEEEEGGKKKKKPAKINSDESSSEECNGGNKKNKKKKMVKKVAKKKKEQGLVEEAFEDSDDGDGEERELEYSGNSDSEKEDYDMIGVRETQDSDEEETEEEDFQNENSSQVQLEENSKSLGIVQNNKTNFDSGTVSKEDKSKKSKNKDNKSEKAGGKKRKSHDDNNPKKAKSKK